jgi:hypothetical protein
MALALSRAPKDLLGTIGASTSLARQLGFALGPALATTVWALSGYALSGMRAGIGLAAAVSALGVIALIREGGRSPVRPLLASRLGDVETDASSRVMGTQAAFLDA